MGTKSIKAKIVSRSFQYKYWMKNKLVSMKVGKWSYPVWGKENIGTNEKGLKSQWSTIKIYSKCQFKGKTIATNQHLINLNRLYNLIYLIY